MEDKFYELSVNIVKSRFLWIFKKKVHFEITDGIRTDYKYSIADLVYHLMSREVSRGDIWDILNRIQMEYKVK